MMSGNRHKRLSQLSSDTNTNTTSSAGLMATIDSNYAEPLYHSRQDMKDKDLIETKARVLQMEKTMKFWSDCLANWREKWRKVRDERNKCRDESRVLSNKLDSMSKELSEALRQKSELEAKVDTLEHQIKAFDIFYNHKQTNDLD
ncbi:unnamed protein product, partial [Medioppia subpectinata]